VATRPVEIYSEVARMHRDGQSGVLCTVIAVDGSTPRSAGAKMVVHADGRTLGSVGGGAVEADTIREALSMIGSDAPRTLDFRLDEESELACGGEMRVYLEPITPGQAVIVVGGGHVGLAVARVASDAGLRVTVVDDRADILSEERFPRAERRLVGGTELLDGDLDVGESSIVVVVTRGHLHDEEWVRHLLPRGPRYLGMIGSANKVESTLATLEAEGLSRSALESIHAPIGIDIGAETPEEIAVSIVAEIIAVMRGVEDTAMLRQKADFKGRNRPPARRIGAAGSGPEGVSGRR